jgi:hypothetical protein
VILVLGFWFWVFGFGFWILAGFGEILAACVAGMLGILNHRIGNWRIGSECNS